MSEPFSIDTSALRKRAKPSDQKTLRSVDQRGEESGFVGREPRKGGRKPSPRTGQVHAKVLPEVRDEILEEATRRGVTQGVLIEEAWALYMAQRGGSGGGS